MNDSEGNEEIVDRPDRSEEAYQERTKRQRTAQAQAAAATATTTNNKTVMTNSLDDNSIRLWVQLINGDNEKVGSPSKVQASPSWDIDDLKKAVKLLWQNRLEGCDAGDLKVHRSAIAASGRSDSSSNKLTGQDLQEGTGMESDEPIPRDTDAKNPIIAVAPKNHSRGKFFPSEWTCQYPD
jgi:hypothetical protein